MTEREGPQERPQRRGSHHPERQHPLRRTRTQHVGMIDMRTARDDRVHQRQDLAARTRTPNPARKPHRAIDQRLQRQSRRQRRDHQQASIGHQVRVVEGHLDPIDRARYSTHRKCLLELTTTTTSTPSSSQPGRHFPRIRAYAKPNPSVDRGLDAPGSRGERVV